jgi:hypothetical protein
MDVVRSGNAIFVLIIVPIFVAPKIETKITTMI